MVSKKRNCLALRDLAQPGNNVAGEVFAYESALDSWSMMVNDSERWLTIINDCQLWLLNRVDDGDWQPIMINHLLQTGSIRAASRLGPPAPWNAEGWRGGRKGEYSFDVVCVRVRVRMRVRVRVCVCVGMDVFCGRWESAVEVEFWQAKVCVLRSWVRLGHWGPMLCKACRMLGPC